MSETDMVLTKGTLALIEENNPGLISSENHGRREVSVGLLNPLSSRSTSGSYACESENESQKITIPTNKQSIATYTYMGFTEATAAILVKWKDDPLENAKAWISETCHGVDAVEDSWNSAMQRAGIKHEIRFAMLQPQHQFILYTQPLAVWLFEIVEEFWAAIDELEDNVRTRYSQPVDSINQSYVRRGAGSGDEEEEEYVVPKTPEGHLAVFKSVSGRLTIPCFSEHNSVNLISLRSRSPTDFHSIDGLYFTHQLWVAKAYSRLINDTCTVADRRTIELHVPLAHLKEINTWYLQFGDTWKKLVWHSRQNMPLPKELKQEKKKYGCIQGPIAHSHTKTITKLKDWSQLSIKHVLQKEEEREDGSMQTLTAVQQVWSDEDAILALQAAVVGKIYVREPEKGFRKVKDVSQDLLRLH